MKRKWALALPIGIVAGGGYAGNVLATPASPTLQTTILAKSTFDPLRLIGNSAPPGLWQVRLRTHGLSDFYVVDNKFSAGDTTAGKPSPQAAQVGRAPAPSGFDWGDAGIGAAAGLGLSMVAVGGSLVIAGKRRHRLDATLASGVNA
jgi:hypothetical protein